MASNAGALWSISGVMRLTRKAPGEIGRALANERGDRKLVPRGAALGKMPEERVRVPAVLALKDVDPVVRIRRSERIGGRAPLPGLDG